MSHSFTFSDHLPILNYISLSFSPSIYFPSLTSEPASHTLSLSIYLTTSLSLLLSLSPPLLSLSVNTFPLSHSLSALSWCTYLSLSVPLSACLCSWLRSKCFIVANKVRPTRRSISRSQRIPSLILFNDYAMKRFRHKKNLFTLHQSNFCKEKCFDATGRSSLFRIVTHFTKQEIDKAQKIIALST